MIEIDRRAKDIIGLIIPIISILFAILLPTIIFSSGILPQLSIGEKIAYSVTAIMLLLAVVLAYIIHFSKNYNIYFKFVFPKRLKHFDIDIVKYNGVNWLLYKYENKPLPSPTPICPTHNLPLMTNNNPDNPLWFCRSGCGYKIDDKQLRNFLNSMCSEIINNDYPLFKEVYSGLLTGIKEPA